MTFILNQTNSIANAMLLELRDKDIQQHQGRFRKNVEKLGTLMAYEISKNLSYKPVTVETPLGKSSIQVLREQPVLITVLRAGLPYFQGFLEVFDQAESGFIGAFRKEGEKEIAINLSYMAIPSLEGRDVLLIDPMLATGKSFVRSVEEMMRFGRPAHLYIAALVSAPEGIAYLTNNISVPHSIWTCALDEKLNEHSYIVPGLGDAGDLCFGEKK